MTDVSAGSITKKNIIPANAVIAMLRPVSTTNSSLTWDLIDSTILATAAAVIAEITTRTAAVSGLSSIITTETTFRTVADNVVTSALTIETSARIAADLSLTSTITNEITARSLAVSALSNTINAEIANRSNAITQEVSSRVAFYNILSNSISTEVSNRTNAISNITITLSTISNAISNAQSRADAAYALASNAAVGNTTTSTVSTGTETIYTANGVISNSDSKVIVNSPNYTLLTLPNGTVNRRQVYIKRIGTGNTVISASLDTVSTTFVMNSPNGSESLLLEWNTYLTTWLIRNYYDPGLKINDLTTATLTSTQNIIVFETDGTPRKTTVGAFAGVISPGLALAATMPISTSNTVTGAPITGLTTVLTPNTATAYAVLYDGSSEVGSRVSFTGNSVPALTPVTVSNTTSVRIYAGSFGGVPLANSALFSVAQALASSATLSGFPTTGSAYSALVLGSATITLTPSNATAYAALSNGTSEIGNRVSFTGTTPPSIIPTAAGNYIYEVFASSTGGSALAVSNTIVVGILVATSATLSGFPTTGLANATLSLSSATITLTPSNATAYAALSNGTAEIGSRVSFTGTTPPSIIPPTIGYYIYEVFASSTGGSALIVSNPIVVSNIASSSLNLTLTNAVFDTTTAKFNQALSGGSGQVTYTNTGSDVDQVFEFWYKRSAAPSSVETIISTSSGLSIKIATNGLAYFDAPGVTSGSTLTNRSSSTNVCDGSWHNIRWSRSAQYSGLCRLYADGAFDVGSLSNAFFTANYTLNITPLGGEIDEMLVTNVYVSGNTYTVPTTPYTRTASTVALYHFDGDGTSA